MHFFFSFICGNSTNPL
ncbi:hypothetical protein SCA6_009761 [Theobroma cacao]